jgi:hypothetical protein
MSVDYFYPKLDAQQKDAVKFIWSQKTVGLFAEQGTGKTWVTLAAIEGLLRGVRPHDFSGIIVCQKNNKETTWRKLIPHLQDVTATSDWEEFKKLKGNRLLLLHYEQMPDMISKLLRFGKSYGWTFVAIDECQRLKARASASSRWAGRLRRMSEYRVGLSGTPLEKSPIDVWGQMRFINPDVFGEKWTRFKRTYTFPTGWMGKKREFREDRIKRFMKAIKPWCMRLTKEALDLPPYRVIKHRFSMPDEALEVYRQMKQRQIVYIPGGEKIRAPLVITRDVKLAQITGGFILGEKGYYWLHNAKLDRTLGVIRDSHLPVVVFCRFLPEVKELAEALSHLRVDTYTGKTKNKAAVQERFQRGELDVLICQTRTGGVGIDLYNARTVIVYSADWSSINFDQLISRVHRRGQVNRVRIHLMIVKASIDNRIHRRINSKLRRIKPIMRSIENDRIQRGETRQRPGHGTPPGSGSPAHRRDREDRRQIRMG